MPSKKSAPTYAYLIRCWREEESALAGRPPWRFSLENVLLKGPRRGFDSLEALVTAVWADLGADSEGPGDQGDCSEGEV